MTQLRRWSFSTTSSTGSMETVVEQLIHSSLCVNYYVPLMRKTPCSFGSTDTTWYLRSYYTLPVLDL
jgi:hypothetical protein